MLCALYCCQALIIDGVPDVGLMIVRDLCTVEEIVPFVPSPTLHQSFPLGMRMSVTFTLFARVILCLDGNRDLKKMWKEDSFRFVPFPHKEGLDP
jgi:hypothetical protein